MLGGMSNTVSTITSKWRVTIPEDLRQKLSLRIGQRIAWEIQDDKLVGRRVPSISELAGCFKPEAPAPPVKKDTPGKFAKAALARHYRISEQKS
ncbi:MAG: prlF antitoxin for toxin YhaV toxin [Pedosphaera sp.]|nr:prlF antitoxin for toxin YhaV toxin [Pedosphaera sp.]